MDTVCPFPSGNFTFCEIAANNLPGQIHNSFFDTEIFGLFSMLKSGFYQYNTGKAHLSAGYSTMERYDTVPLLLSYQEIFHRLIRC